MCGLGITGVMRVFILGSASFMKHSLSLPVWQMKEFSPCVDHFNSRPRLLRLARVLDLGFAQVHCGSMMVSLEGVSDEWEGCAVVRSQYRESRRLFVFEGAGKEDKHDPPIHVKTAAANRDALLPLMKRIGQARKQLFTIAMVEAESLIFLF